MTEIEKFGQLIKEFASILRRKQHLWNYAITQEEGLRKSAAESSLSISTQMANMAFLTCGLMLSADALVIIWILLMRL